MSIRRCMLAMGGGALALFMLTAPPALAIEFGDDSSQWANDGECDDPRFEGPGMAIAGSLTDANIMRDATDCQALYDAGQVTLIGGTPAGTGGKDDGPDVSGIDFGDDSGEYALDGECDDPRFEGPGVWTGATDDFVLRDATDCREAVLAGTATYVGGVDGIDYGDDSGEFPFDGECDDPRFTGPGVWDQAGPEGVRADATDCREAVEAGTATYVGEVDDVSGTGGVDYGDDSGPYPFDGECDDPRFEGPGVWDGAGPDGVRTDATDCREAVEAGTAFYMGEYVGAPSETSGFGTDAIDYGDDSGEFPFDGECDDPRFTGPGVWEFAGPEGVRADATDCREAVEAGTATYVGEVGSADPSGIDQGGGVPAVGALPLDPPETTLAAGLGDELIGVMWCSAIFYEEAFWYEDAPAWETYYDALGNVLGLEAESQLGDLGWSQDRTDELWEFYDSTVADTAEDDVAAFEADLAVCEDAYGGVVPHPDSGAAEGGGAGADLSGIDFGDDSGPYPLDGECDDPRFTGPGVWDQAGPDGVRADATDCREAVEAGTATYVGETGADIDIDAIDFGDDSGPYPFDGECDDPRFTGPGVWNQAGPDGVRADATDCREAVEAGTATYVGDAAGHDLVDWGDDGSEWANDGECDDPRFDGPGMAVAESLTDANIRRDATDCRALYEAGEIWLLGQSGEIDFGDDTGMYPNDGECDDPRFEGPGMAVASSLTDANAFGDATDCRALHEAGQVWLAGEAGDADVSGVDFGDDNGPWPNDGECDDPRFEGPGMAAPEYLRDENRFADATDCRELFLAGRVTLIPGADSSTIEFGDDSGDWPNDRECDDPRFQGPGMATRLSDDNVMRDASDCLALFDAGLVTLATLPGAAPGDHGNAVHDGIDFGDDSSEWAFNDECDDPRFEGEGVAAILLFADRMADASDCLALYEAGLIAFAGVSGSPAAAGIEDIDFGDDTSDWADNGVCDDPRFEGPGVDSILLQMDRGHDAADCRALFEAGEISLAGVAGEG